jgi:MFS superfamily sulfate permease-like transporter
MTDTSLNSNALRFDCGEFAGAVADLGVFVPIAVALVVKNGLSPTAVLLPAALLYIAAGLLYRLPVPVQPLKAFGAIAIAKGLGSSAIAAGALLMGAIFVLLGASGLLDRIAKVFPHSIIRGIQLSVGLLFCQLAWTLTTKPPAAFLDHSRPIWWLIGGSVLVIAAALVFRRRNISLLMLVLAVAGMVSGHHGSVLLGPSPMHAPELDIRAFTIAAVALVIPQLPLTFANSCLATADAARTYFGDRAVRVKPGRLALSLGIANLFAGVISGMPVCHGAGGMTAHRSFGARTGGAPIMIGSALLFVAVLLGASLSAVFAGFPLPILAGLLTVSGLLHIALLRDLQRPVDWTFAVATGIIGFLANLAVALIVALLVWWLARAAGVVRDHAKA